MEEHELQGYCLLQSCVEIWSAHENKGCAQSWGAQAFSAPGSVAHDIDLQFLNKLSCKCYLQEADKCNFFSFII